MCSTTGGSITAIANAIDQLAADAKGQTSAADMTTRLADIWSMVAALDPDLARRQRKYTGQEPDPSAM